MLPHSEAISARLLQSKQMVFLRRKMMILDEATEGEADTSDTLDPFIWRNSCWCWKDELEKEM